MLLNIIPLSSDCFTNDDGCLVAEASDLRGHQHQRLYDDACDVGLAIQSTRTNRIVTFFLSKTITNELNEVEGWVYLPIPQDVRKYGLPANLSVKVFND